jgi:serine/threonine protein kinase
VHLARDLELDEEVALKVLPAPAADEATVRRFLNEIRIARRITHPNVVRTHDVGRWGGWLFLTMEYFRGRPLDRRIAAGPRLTPGETVAVGRQLADALAAAHAQGVIHRDIKPHNLLVDDTGLLKVLDFGIAVVQGNAGVLTETGVVVGSPAYMSPEQLMGETLTPATDLYAAGVVLYECLTGRLPIAATTPMSFLAQLMHHGPTPILEVAPDIPAPLAGLVTGLLRPVADRTPPTAAALAEALRGWS